MAGVIAETRTLGRPRWLKDFQSDWILPIPARIDPTQFHDVNAVRIVNSGDRTGGLDQIERLTVLGGPTGGTFKATFNAVQSGTIAYNASKATLQAALEAISTIGAGNVKVSGPNGGPWVVVYINRLGKQANTGLTIDYSALTGGTSPTVSEVVDVIGAPGEVSLNLAVPLTAAVPAGTLLDFGIYGNAASGYSRSLAMVELDAAAGDSILYVENLTEQVLDAAVAYYNPVTAGGRRFIPSGTLVGRTFTERASNVAFGLATDTDDEIFFIPFDVVDANSEADCELLRHGCTIAENFLPQATQDLLTANTALRTKIRAFYVTELAEA